MSNIPPTIHAPEINRDGLFWLNVDAPLSLKNLRGKLVLLDFWTFCCINCMHILPTLRKVEELFAKEVMVIGVHSPKFAAEKSIENVKQAIARYDIRHPVIHDPDFILWRAYDIHAWPTLVFIDPAGYVIGVNSGEPEPLHLLNNVRDALDDYEEKGLLAPSAFSWAKPKQEKSTLSFPGKIKPLPGTSKPGAPKQWIVADSGHHQIVVFDDKGCEVQRFGAGYAGCEDGSPQTATFNAPQGLIANERAIFVADTGNHAIRKIDRQNGAVTTLCGTGERGMMLFNKFERATGRALASPWDLELKNDFLFFANAGTHQIGAIDLAHDVVRVIAGNSEENLRDGDPLTCTMAQPSGLVLNTAQDKLYFADSETSSIRYIDMKDIKVRTLIGTGLFDFGHRNGPLADGLLQHALGLCFLDDQHIVVADSYNAALRLIDLEAGTLSDLDEQGWTCMDDLCLPFAEPAGVWADGKNRLLLSDTNNHRILEINRSAKTSRKWA